MLRSKTIAGILVSTVCTGAVLLAFAGFETAAFRKMLSRAPASISSAYVDYMLRGQVFPVLGGGNVAGLIRTLHEMEQEDVKLSFDRALLQRYALEDLPEGFDVPFFVEPGPRVAMALLLLSPHQEFRELNFEAAKWQRHCIFVREHMRSSAITVNHEVFIANVCHG